MSTVARAQGRQGKRKRDLNIYTSRLPVNARVGFLSLSLSRSRSRVPGHVWIALSPGAPRSHRACHTTQALSGESEAQACGRAGSSAHSPHIKTRPDCRASAACTQPLEYWRVSADLETPGGEARPFRADSRGHWMSGVCRSALEPRMSGDLDSTVIIMNGNQEESASMADFSTSGKTEATVWAGKARPVLDRSFNSLTDAARVRVSGFNPCLQGE